MPETKQWVAAENLKVGTKVLLSDGSYGIVEAVKPIHYNTPQTTYNFEVADVHTYYVGNGVLVHNMNGINCGKRPYATHSSYNDARNTIGKKNTDIFMTAMNKGPVGGKGQNGIKRLAGQGVIISGKRYQYEVKVFGDLANYRFYGNYDADYGGIIFSEFGKAFH